MLKHILTIVFIIAALSVGAQNLVRNPSFEVMDTCFSHCENETQNSIPNAYGWFNPTMNSPDIFCKCNYPNILPESIQEQYSCLYQYVPFNWRGFQFPFEGNNYAGISIDLMNIISNAIDPGSREYISGEFVLPISKKKYCVSMYISQASTLYYKYILNQTNSLYTVVNKIGFNITYGRPLYNTMGSVYLNPSITFEHPTEIYFSDTLNWEKVNMPFEALGGERYFTIGNFYREDDIQFQVVTDFNLDNPETAYETADCYIYIDNVEVIEIPELSVSADTAVYPQSSISLSTPTLAEGYEWFEGDTLHSLGGGNAITISPEINTSYFLKATQCKLTTWDTVNVTVIPRPILPVNISFLNTITSSQFQINYQGDNRPVLDVEVYNSVGQIVKTMQLSESSFISLETFSAGIYYCRLSKDGIPIQTAKVVKGN